MKMRDRLERMAAMGAAVGSVTYVDADTIPEAEQYIDLYPKDAHGYANSVKIEVTTKEEAMSMLSQAGYAWTGDKGDRICSRAQFVATVTRHSSGCIVWIGPGDGMEAWAAGPGGYLRPDDRPEV